MSIIGSVWRKWDLHIHTPASFLWRGERFLGMNEERVEAACRATVAAINDSQAAVFAVMDYWTFDGYVRLKRFLHEHPDVELRKREFPGMELRCEAPVPFRLNIHVILSD